MGLSVYMQMEALPQLTVRQLAEVSATPGQLTSADQVDMVTKHVPGRQLAAFFDDFSPAIMVGVRHTYKLHANVASQIITYL